MHQMDDVTAEVDEREEYSNDFEEETASRGACKLSDLAKHVDTKKLLAQDSDVKKKEDLLPLNDYQSSPDNNHTNINSLQ